MVAYLLRWRGVRVLAGVLLATWATWAETSAPAQDAAPAFDAAPPTAESNQEGEPQLDEVLGADIADLAKMSIAPKSDSSLGQAPSFDTPVSTVSRTESTVGMSPAAVYVITGEMIRRSGVRTIPDALRLAPGVQVAQIDANKWAISIRGHNNRFANKLLVQIDGRTVYTPTFGGVYWDVQDLLLEDIDRIEVIRGPGATVWGTNAVNGVINILTKSSQETVGIHAAAGGGTEERDFTQFRVGGRNDAGLSWRVYGKQFDRDRQFDPLANDQWRMKRGGFRMDYEPDCLDTFTLQGDIYDGEINSFLALPDPAVGVGAFPAETPLAGGNLLGRWARRLSDESDWQIQCYYDRTERDDLVVNDQRDMYDLDFQHRFPLGGWNEVIWGFEYRYNSDQLAGNGVLARFDPQRRDYDETSVFVQDKVTLLADEMFFWIGTKLGHNDFTGWEVQPNARWLWAFDPQRAVWASVSRAVRIPTRAEHDLAFLQLLPPAAPGVFPTIAGNDSAVSETVIAYELGYRAQPAEFFAWDLAGFYNDYDNIVVLSPTANPLALEIANLGQAQTYGVELTADVYLAENWNVRGGYTFLHLEEQSSSPIRAVPGEGGTSPHNQFFLHSSWDFADCVALDLIGRYVDHLPALNVPKYITLDARLAAWLTPNVELSVVGRNLLDGEHPEFESDTFAGAQATQVQRSVYGMMTWTY
jgi:iron complex outermembrane receptor protein